ncbi:hypothetical protein D3C87_1427160 [compost metagenome]
MIVSLYLDELPAEATHRLFRAISCHADNVETANGILGEIARKLRFDADDRCLRLHRQRQRSFDGAATGLAHPNGDVGGKQLRGGRQIRQIDIEACLAFFVQSRKIGKRGAIFLFAFLIR